MQNFFDQIGVISRAEVTSQRYCPIQAHLMHDRCWFCACAPCMSDLLFLIDQSALVDPVACRSVLNEFDFNLGSEPENNNLFEGSRKQIDFVMATIQQVYAYNQGENMIRMHIGAVRVAVAIYGDSSSYETIIDFDETFSQEKLIETTKGIGSLTNPILARNFGDGFIG